MLLMLLYLMTAAWLIYGISLWTREVRLAKSGIALTAHVKGNETNDGRLFRPVIGYTYEGKYYETVCSYADKAKLDVGTPMEIRILAGSPNKPERAGTSLRRTYGFSFVVGALALGASLYVTFWR